MSYHYDPQRPDRLYRHGTRESRLIQVLASGAPVSVTVTVVDGLVYSRTAFHHSMNYRSVVRFGRAHVIEDEAEQRTIFEAMTERYFPGRRAGVDYQPATAQQLAATLLVEIVIGEWSAKARRGGPRGPYDTDPTAPGTAWHRTPKGVTCTDDVARPHSSSGWRPRNPASRSCQYETVGSSTLQHK